MSTSLSKRVLILEDSTTQSRIIAKMFVKLDFTATAVADQQTFTRLLCDAVKHFFHAKAF